MPECEQKNLARADELSPAELFADLLPAQGQLILAQLHSVDAVGAATVSFELGGKSFVMPALSSVALEANQQGRQVVLSFVRSTDIQPVILGLLHNPLDAVLASTVDLQNESAGLEMHADGRRIAFEASEELCLKCGDASITLKKNGKIAIRGKYVLSRSTGVNRVLGGSVQIN
ncbi:DUF6484 domain-containing protein [Agaribacterium haliotis]|uniref:DUF6484 domain-containing protein n=1 Tax=Agaribacterium haliotis TaxID=2013869 RepID=UPI000BB52F40|nr:DUF6484 domain-containing protein [Agaribacterium haliotis]